MSAFIVGHETMQRCAIGFLLGTMPYGAPLANEAEVTETGRKLYAMNQQALVERYNDNTPAPEFTGQRMRPLTYSKQELVQIYKSMHCLLYQCSEGDVPDSELFKQLELAAGAVASRIVNMMHEYQQATWD